MSSRRFPWLPVLTIALCRVCAGYIGTSQFAYAGYMVEYLGVVKHKDKAGYFSGFLVSSFMIGRFSSSYLWGWLADRYGRLPVLYFGLVAVAVLSAAFGVSTSFSGAVSCRLLMGMLTGVTPVARAMISEVCGREHEVVGMSIVTTAWSITTVIGPGIGGLLAEPATNYPRLFSQSGFFGRNPYLLPNLVAVGLAVASLVMVLCFLHETKQSGGGDSEAHDEHVPIQEPVITSQAPTSPSQELGEVGSANDRHRSDDGCTFLDEAKDHLSEGSMKGGFHKVEDDGYQSDGDIILSNEGTKHPPGADDNRLNQGIDGEGREGTVFDYDSASKPLPPRTLLDNPHVRVLLIMQGLFSFIQNGIEEVFPLWALSTVARGGLDWTTKDIGQVLFGTGISLLVFETAVKPRFVRQIGIRRLHRWGSVSTVVVFLAIPYLSLLHGTESPLIATSSALLLVKQASAIALVVNLVVETNNAVGPTQLGEVNGLASTTASLGRAFAPFSCAPLFAWSINGNHQFPFNAHFSFILLALGTVVFSIIGWRIIGYNQNKQESGDDIVEMTPVGDLV